jgi:dihydroorotate dehydrogenase electron transfer subunit
MTNKHEQPTVLPIKRIIEEAKNFRTLVFEYSLPAQPGQFIMLWMPGVDAKPFAVSHQTKSEFHLAILAVGSFTHKIMELKIGDKLGIFGPYGKGYNLMGKKVMMVGGGSGTPPLKFLAYEAVSRGIEVDFIWGARNIEYLPYREELEKAPFASYICSDDGSIGEKGFTTDLLVRKLSENKYDAIYTCGPEIMMQKVMDLSDKYQIPCQISMERYMKCGFGVCGQCAVDGPGVPVCTHGPVFNKEFVRTITEFTVYHRNAKGEKLPPGGGSCGKN